MKPSDYDISNLKNRAHLDPVLNFKLINLVSFYLHPLTLC